MKQLTNRLETRFSVLGMSGFRIISCFVALSTLGLLVIHRFSVDLNPAHLSPKVTVSFFLPDATPEIVEENVTSQLENSFAQISQIKQMYSVSHEGFGIVELTFDEHADLQFKKFEIASIVREVYPKLKPQPTYPQWEQRGRDNQSKKPLLIYQVNADFTPLEISNAVKGVFQTDIAQIAGVNTVNVVGAVGSQITISYDYDQMVYYGVSAEDISKAISQSFNPKYVGFANTSNDKRIRIAVEGRLTDLSHLKNLEVRKGGRIVLLKNIARVESGESQHTSYHRVNGLNSISLVVYANDEVNRVRVATEVKETVERLVNRLPVGYQLQLQYDDTDFVVTELRKNFVRSGIAILVLAVFALLAYRTWRYLVILFASLAVNLSLTALTAYLLNISIHLYTIAGITIALGMMIDNIVFILDHLKHKSNPNIFRALLGATLTTILALLMVLTLPAEERNNLSEFAVIVSISLATSILVAIFFVPALHSRVTKEDEQSKEPRYSVIRQKAHSLRSYTKVINVVAKYRKLFLIFLILSFGTPVFLLPSRWSDHEWYNRTIGGDYYQDRIKPWVDRILGGTLRPFVQNVFQQGGYRAPGRTRLLVRAELPYGNTLSEMDRIIRSLEAYIGTVDGVENFVTTISSGQLATVEITFEKRYERSALPVYLKNQLASRSLDWGGVNWWISGVGQGFNNSSSANNMPTYRVEMRGYSYIDLQFQAERLAEKLKKHQRVRNVNIDEHLASDEKSTFQWSLNFKGIGTNPGMLASSLREKAGAFNSEVVIEFNGQLVPVKFLSIGGELEMFKAMNNYLQTQRGLTKLAQQAQMTLVETPSAIHKENRQYVRVIGFEYLGSSKIGSAYLDTVLEEISREMPAGYTAINQDLRWDWGQTQRQYSVLLIMIIGIYFLATILFEDFRLSLLIILSIPISFIGVFLTFYWGRFFFDQGGYAAFVLLAGITVNGSIFIINDYKSMLNKRNKHLNSTIIKAVAGKMRPLLLTITSTCLGLVPFLLGGESEVFWFSLAVGTMGGLIASIFVFILVLPVMLWANPQPRVQ